MNVRHFCLRLRVINRLVAAIRRPYFVISKAERLGRSCCQNNQEIARTTENCQLNSDNFYAGLLELPNTPITGGSSEYFGHTVSKDTDISRLHGG